jgi:Arc/MetJ-type ribon-helix-helix transcriptional regulator
MKVELNQEAERLIKESLDKGGYRSAEEVVLAGLRRIRAKQVSMQPDVRTSEPVPMDYIISQMHDDAIHGRDRMRACGAMND